MEEEVVLDENSVIEEFESITKSAAMVQNQTLARILQQNSSAEYLLDQGLAGRTDPQSFKACVPIVTHKELEPYIQRIADGQTSPILTTKQITTISLSSGTTQGKPKFVPFNEDLMENTLQIYHTSFAYRNRQYPLENGKSLMFIYSSKQFITKGGVAAGTATTNVFRNPKFKTGMKGILLKSCSPDEVIFGPDFHQSLYCHLLCGLLYREEIQFVFSTFAHSLVLAFRTFEHVWEELCTDIREGVLSSRVTAPSVRAAVSKLLKPNPELADLIYKKCSGLSNWYNLIPELFPNAKYIYGIMTGAMEPYVKKLRIYAGELPLVGHDYGASEGWIAANVNPTLPPELATFAVLPDIGYFEFIPMRESLYRYKLGDVVKVMGFHNSTPELKFVCRRNLMLSINIDKNTEKDLQLAVEEAEKVIASVKLEMVDFTSHIDLSTDPGHYVIFWEVNGKASEDILQECCNCLDKSFVDAGYISSRKVKGIGPLELRILEKGTFQKIVDHYVGLGSAVSQFKTPRYVGPMNSVVFQILCSNVVENYFSTAY
ncbi:hypothetical protein ACFE04_026542 [Oxalis oulophora]